jgi:hypothetical protein
MGKNKYNFSVEDINRIIEMAWEDRTHFEAIEKQFGISQDGKRFWNFNLRHVNSTYKGNLETMRNSVYGSHKKFLYYDGSAYYYVRMSNDSLRFNEIAFGVYSTKIKLTEQLS